MTAGTLEHILSRVTTLPALPIIVYKLLKLIESPTSTATELSEVVAKDQALTARILRLVNSSFYALCSEVVRVPHAIALLGFTAVRNLALGLGVLDMFGRERESADFHGDAVWEHTLCCAICARFIAERVGYVPVEEAFVAGLLHDIGKLVLFDHCRPEFDAALRTAREELVALHQAERLLLGTDHAEIGGVLAEHWRLPRGLRGPIRGHHAFTADDKLTGIVYLANALSKAKQIGSAGNLLLEPLDGHTLASLGLDEPAVLRLMGRLRREVERAKASVMLAGAPGRMAPERVDTQQLWPAAAATRVLLVEEEPTVTSLVELVLLDHGHTTYRTTDPSHPAAAVADVVLLDFPTNLERGELVRAQIELRLDGRRPAVLLPWPRRARDVIEAVNAALAGARV
jgi:HD-like signal output (HDOD) protein